MTWLRVDDNEDQNVKLALLDDATFRLYHHSRLYCARELTDGWVPAVVLPKLTMLRDEALETAIRALLRVPPTRDHGLWTVEEGGYRIHDYLEYNPTRAEVISARVDRIEAGRRGGHRSAELRDARRHAPAQANAQALAQAHAQASAQAKGQAKSNPVPVPGPVPVSEPVPDPNPNAEDKPRRVGMGTEGRKEPRPEKTGRPARKSGAAGAGLAAAAPSANGQGVHSGPESAVRPTDLQAAAAHGAAIRLAIETWLGAFEKAHGTKPVLRKGVDAAILARLIRNRGDVEEVCRLIRGFFETGTKWSRENNAWTVGAFESQYNKLLVMDADGQL